MYLLLSSHTNSTSTTQRTARQPCPARLSNIRQAPYEYDYGYSSSSHAVQSLSLCRIRAAAVLHIPAPVLGAKGGQTDPHRWHSGVGILVRVEVVYCGSIQSSWQYYSCVVILMPVSMLVLVLNLTLWCIYASRTCLHLPASPTPPTPTPSTPSSSHLIPAGNTQGPISPRAQLFSTSMTASLPACAISTRYPRQCATE